MVNCQIFIYTVAGDCYSLYKVCLLKMKIKEIKTSRKLDKSLNKVIKNNDSTNKTSKKADMSVKMKKQNIVKKVNPIQLKTKKESLMSSKENLKKIDPEFYKFLEKNDKSLLEYNFNDSDESEGDEDTVKVKQLSTMDNDEEPDEEDEILHIPSEKLEVASDESDFETEETETANATQQKVTLNLLRQWQVSLESTNVPVTIVRKVIQAFNAALASLNNESNEEISASGFKVEGSAAFNGIVQLCVLHLPTAIWRILGISSNTNQPVYKSKKWVKLRSCLRYYLIDLTQLIQQISSHNLISVLLKHLHQIAPIVGCYTTLCKTILKRLINLWSTEDETIRILAYLCILRITRNQQNSMLNPVLKTMYQCYVRNSKFVNPNTLPNINFMRRSLMEMFALDLRASYQHVFLYIRQLAIHLRNAVVLKKKDNNKMVYNWQFINSLHLWSDLLGATAYKPQLQPLVYPLVTIIIGTIRLIPTAQYFPLRFHCIQMLINLSKQANVFIPLLPFITEVLRSTHFNNKHTKVSMKPQSFACLLRLNKIQLTENGFRDETIEQVFALLLEYLAHESSTLGFCELVVPIVLELKSYLKTCRIANYSRKIKQLLDKIKENSDFILKERNSLTCSLKELDKVKSWEMEISNKGTPLDIYYKSWIKMHETKKRRQAAKTDSVNDDYNLPSINKQTNKKLNVTARNENGQPELFPDTDSENDLPIEELENEEMEDKSKKAKQKKNKKQNKKEQVDKIETETPVHDEEEDDNDEIDIIKDLDLNDW